MKFGCETDGSVPNQALYFIKPIVKLTLIATGGLQTFEFALYANTSLIKCGVTLRHHQSSAGSADNETALFLSSLSLSCKSNQCNCKQYLKGGVVLVQVMHLSAGRGTQELLTTAWLHIIMKEGSPCVTAFIVSLKEKISGYG